MGWFSDITGGIFEPVSSEVAGVENAIVENPKTTAVLLAAAGGGYYYYYGGTEALAAAEAGTEMTATAESGSAALAPVSDAVAVPVSQIPPYVPPVETGAVSGIDLGGAGASPASWTNAPSSSGWTSGQIASTASSGLNLASSATKLAILGKSMDAQSATANGLTGALGPSPIQTPSGLITTTPQGPVMTGTQPQSGGFMGMDNQTLFVIAAGIAAVYYFSKHGK